MRILICVVLIMLIWLGVVRVGSHKGQITLPRICGVLIFGILMTVVFMLTGIYSMSGFSMQIHWDSVSYIPFRGIGRMIMGQGFSRYVITNIFGNILMFMPLGFFIPLLFKKQRHFIVVLLWGFFTSLLIEGTQLFIIRGTDVDDLILNTTGAVVGYIVFMCFYKNLKNSFEKTDKTKPQCFGWQITPLLCIGVPYLCSVAFGLCRLYL